MDSIKFDQAKIPWDLLPVEATEAMLRVLWYGKRKYTICKKCNQPLYQNPKLPDMGGEPDRETNATCPKCGGTEFHTGAHNWRKGFHWTRLIAAAFRHLKAILQCEDKDPESGELHAAHLMCCVSFLLTHQLQSLGVDNRYRSTKFQQ